MPSRLHPSLASPSTARCWLPLYCWMDILDRTFSVDCLLLPHTDSPIGFDGFVEIPSGRRVAVAKVQLEEDTAAAQRDQQVGRYQAPVPKEGCRRGEGGEASPPSPLLHGSRRQRAAGTEDQRSLPTRGEKLLLAVGGRVLLDANRAGTPLIEVVTKAESLTADEAAEFVYELLTDLRNAGIWRGTMAAGRLRCDLNLSLRCLRTGRDFPRVELKNVRSLKAVRRAVHAEEERQRDVLARGVSLLPETRHWDDSQRRSVRLRSKLNSSRVYFPFEETQIPEVVLDAETKAQIRSSLVPPAATRRQIYAQWGLGAAVRIQLARDLEVRILSLREGYKEKRRQGHSKEGGRAGRDEGEAEWAGSGGRLSRFFEALVAAGASPVRSGLFLLNELQAALKGVSSPGPIEPADLALALCAAERGTLTNKTLRLYAAALSRGDPNAKQLLTEEPGATEAMEATAVKDLEHILKASKKHRPGTLLGKLLSLHPGLCPLKARHLIDNALASQTQKKDTNITQPGALG
ncbi:glutamyl-tRNA amidotransferase subunit mitochondrial related [Cyclospora cayetanensis]|uniref:Glutamyl-tRNA amidotransferase subunit mitochondrial related n=1 Tax=Cyclospora cayetanensis TaxID=88456 RepID=A0A1D3CXT3_9EIME|nr:glutamyl-tRNA amidotransferase subunit mitochondrial related [Cyclospora cayetanensis]